MIVNEIKGKQEKKRVIGIYFTVLVKRLGFWSMKESATT